MFGKNISARFARGKLLEPQSSSRRSFAGTGSDIPAECRHVIIAPKGVGKHFPKNTP